MVEVLPNLVKAIEFCRFSPNGLIKVMSSQEVTLSPTIQLEFYLKRNMELPSEWLETSLCTPNLLYSGSLRLISLTIFSGIRENGIGK
jgi:hypothetical protein